jgi:hypothetical protein
MGPQRYPGKGQEPQEATDMKSKKEKGMETKYGKYSALAERPECCIDRMKQCNDLGALAGVQRPVAGRSVTFGLMGLVLRFGVLGLGSGHLHWPPHSSPRGRSPFPVAGLGVRIRYSLAG